MRVLTTSVTALAAAALFASASAYACDFHMQATAQATTPAPVKEQVVESSKIDPVLLAYLKRVNQADQPADTAEAD